MSVKRRHAGRQLPLVAVMDKSPPGFLAGKFAQRPAETGFPGKAFSAHSSVLPWKTLVCLLVLGGVSAGAAEAPGEPVAKASSVPKPPVTYQFRAFVLEGNKVLSTESLQEVLKPFIGKDIALGEIQRIETALFRAYSQRGFLVRSTIPDQDLTGGNVRIIIVEATLGEVSVVAPADLRYDPDRAKRIVIKNLAETQALAVDDMERAVGVLDALPGIAADLSLLPSNKVAGTDMKLTLTNTEPFNATAQVDNLGLESTGVLRTTVNLQGNSLMHQGERTFYSGLHSEGLLSHTGEIEAPVGHRGTMVAIGGRQMDYNVINNQVVGVLGIEGSSVSYWLRLRNPEFRLLGLPVQSEFGFDYSLSEDYLDLGGIGITKSGHRLTRCVYAGASSSYVNLARTASYSLALKLTFGDLELGEFVSNDAGGTQGGFVRFNADFGFQAKLGKDYFLSLAVAGQMCDKNLDRSQEVSFSGASAVRGYEPGLLNVDEGIYQQLELSRSVSSQPVGIAVHRLRLRARQSQYLAGVEQCRRVQFLFGGRGGSWPAWESPWLAVDVRPIRPPARPLRRHHRTSGRPSAPFGHVRILLIDTSTNMNAARRPSRGIISLATLIYLGCVGSFAAPPAVDALPSGMTVLPGSTHGVSATVNGNTMTINAGAENSNLQTIRTQWQSFDIGAQATVNINNVKPPRVIGIERGWNPAEKSDVFLVSVSGNSPTQIFGRLNAPGYNLVLLNQNGVVFGPGARVDAGGIIASSLAIDKFERYDDALYIEVNGELVPDPWGASGTGYRNSTQAFFALDFSGQSQALVRNEGVLSGRYVALVGLNVEQAGQVSVTRDAALVAGDAARLVINSLAHGDQEGKLSVTLRPGSRPLASIAQQGQIQAGENVFLMADVAEQVLQDAIAGQPAARQVVVRDGRLPTDNRRRHRSGSLDQFRRRSQRANGGHGENHRRSADDPWWKPRCQSQRLAGVAEHQCQDGSWWHDRRRRHHPGQPPCQRNRGQYRAPWRQRGDPQRRLAGRVRTERRRLYPDPVVPGSIRLGAWFVRLSRASWKPARSSGPIRSPAPTPPSPWLVPS